MWPSAPFTNISHAPSLPASRRVWLILLLFSFRFGGISMTFKKFAGALLCSAFLLAAGSAARAEGPGRYKVEGNNGKPGTDYTGTATITRTGETWRISWTVGDDKYDGFAVGDGRVLSATFASSGSTGAALLVSDDKGGYISVWAFKGDTTTGVEKFTPREK
jgi:hypothetical protein